VRYLVRRRINAGATVLQPGTVLEESDVAGWRTLRSLINIGHLEAVPDLPPAPPGVTAPPAKVAARRAPRPELAISLSAP
jgi:hypothetical protein